MDINYKIEMDIPNFLLQNKCQQKGHEELNYIMMCLNDNCLNRGEPICPECQFDKHNHNAEDSFVTLQKLKKFLEDNQFQKLNILQSAQKIMENYHFLKKNIMVLLEDTEQSLKQKIQQLEISLDFRNISQIDLQQNNLPKVLENLFQFSELLCIDNKQLQFINFKEEIQKYQEFIQKTFSDISFQIERMKQEGEVTVFKDSKINLNNIIIENINLSLVSEKEIQQPSIIIPNKNTKQISFKVTDSRFEINCTGSWYYDGNQKCDGIVIELQNKKSVNLWGIKCNPIKDWENNGQIEIKVIICLGTELKKKQIYCESYIISQDTYQLDKSNEYFDLFFTTPVKVEPNKKYAIGLLYSQPFETTQGKKPKQIDIFKFSECTDYLEDYPDNGTCLLYGQIPKLIYEFI